ncbi:unnamed protein product [Ilex paraguariensis]|uniref:Uncharacterized protein n=1 Tax=Ilex paraguariensis TaxID=185542 RepID=A0ABC8T4U5_9AQUA
MKQIPTRYPPLHCSPVTSSAMAHGSTQRYPYTVTQTLLTHLPWLSGSTHHSHQRSQGQHTHQRQLSPGTFLSPSLPLSLQSLSSTHTIHIHTHESLSPMTDF